MPAERLQKIMARAGLGSRRKCETLIKAGRVSVNGKVATLGDKADLGRDEIRFDGEQLTFPKPIYIKLYKPKGYLSSTTDELQLGRSTILDLVNQDTHIYPVGRLDKQSEGLMLLTNDGPLTHLLTHPKYGHKKLYEVVIAGQISNDDLNRWRDGIYLDGHKSARVKIRTVQSSDDHSKLLLTMREGRKRQIRRIAAALGYSVDRLTRLQIGPIELSGLKPGQWKYLSEAEVQMLKESVNRESGRQG